MATASTVHVTGNPLLASFGFDQLDVLCWALMVNGNASLEEFSLSILAEIGGWLEIAGNGNLTGFSLGNLAHVGEKFVVKNNAKLAQCIVDDLLEQLDEAPVEETTMMANDGECPYTCNLLEQDCGEQEGCYFDPEFGMPVCSDAGDGQEGAPCNGELTDCAAGLMCLSTLGSEYMCRKLCSMQGGEPSCDPGGQFPTCSNYYAVQKTGFCKEE